MDSSLAKWKHVGMAILGISGSVLLLGIDCGGGGLSNGADAGNGQCAYNGGTHAEGTQFPSIDGCNTCSCMAGSVACTQKACAGQWWKTCGDPVCGPGGHRVDPKVPACTTQKVGDPCASLGVSCDPIDPCNVHFECATSDPTKQTGGCPISRAKYKENIRYLNGPERAAVARDILELPLATWRYRDGDGAPHLGFIIDDAGASPAVRPDGDHVDLYGYTSMTVAAIQEQAQRVAVLEKEVRALKAELAKTKVKPARR